jgi:hypothetical protein
MPGENFFNVFNVRVTRDVIIDFVELFPCGVISSMFSMIA